MVVKDNELTPKSGNKSNDLQTIPVPVPVTKETQAEVFKKNLPDVKSEGNVASHGTAKFNGTSGTRTTY